MEFWVRLSISRHGRGPDGGSALLDAIEAVAPGTHPVIDQDLCEGRLSPTISVDALDAADAVEQGRPVLTKALVRAGLPMTRLIGIEVNPAPIAEPKVPAA